jgi:tRNA pseudouridine13 synthase
MKGGYRRVIQRPIDFEWDLITYTDEKIPLVETDLDVLSKTKPLEVNELLSDGISSCTSHDSGLEASLDASESINGASLVVAEAKSIGSSDMLEKLAIKLAFTLPASSYATMAIRELMKTSTSVAHQKTLNI